MNKKGFTLIEIIIVIVILGILATLALPRLTVQSKSAEATEAMQFFGMVKRAAMDCYDSTSTFVDCDTAAEVNVSVPSPTRFTYGKSSTGGTELVITAYRKSANALTNEYLSMRVANDGTVKFNALSTSPFLGIVNKTGESAAITAASSAVTF